MSIVSNLQVTAVIPTVGRPELARAVDCVLNQTASGIELIVVADMADDDPRASSVRAVARDAQLIFTGGRAGAARARNLGIRAAQAPWIAFLDDDDFWTVDKVETQIAAAASTGATVLSSRVDQVTAAGQHSVGMGVPSRLIGSEQSPAQYLFVNRRPGSSRASLFTSTLFVQRQLATRIMWDENLSRHQDWDWVIRLSKDRRYKFHHHPDSLTSIVVGSTGSISSGSDWRSSLDWGKRVLQPSSRRVFADFVAGQPLRYALQARSWDGLVACVTAIVKTRKMPSVGPLIIGLAGLLSRQGIERAMRLFK